MGDATEAKQRKPGRPKKTEKLGFTDADLITQLTADLKKALNETEKLANFAMDELDGTVQFRESSGVLRLMEKKANIDGLSINKWVRKVARQKVGL